MGKIYKAFQALKNRGIDPLSVSSGAGWAVADSVLKGHQAGYLDKITGTHVKFTPAKDGKVTVSSERLVR